jgi:hypothetical protein
MPMFPPSEKPASNQPANDEPISYEARLRDALNLIIAVGVFIWPWYNGDDLTTHGSIRTRILAIVIGSVSLWILVHQRQILAECLNAALGAALVTTPWWHGGIDATRLDSAVAGAVILAFSISCAIQIRRESSMSRFERLGEFLIRASPHNN